MYDIDATANATAATLNATENQTHNLQIKANTANINADNWTGGTLYLVIKLYDWYSTDFFTSSYSYPSTKPAAAITTEAGWQGNANTTFTPRQKVISLPITVKPVQ